MIQDESIRDLVSCSFKEQRVLKKTAVYDRAYGMGKREKDKKKKRRMKQLVEKGTNFVLTADFWSTEKGYTDSAYLGVGIHYVDMTQKKRVSEILALKPALASRTAEFTRRAIREILEDFAIPEDAIFATTTDNGSDVKCAFHSEETRGDQQNFDWYWVPCSSHTLALTVNDIFEPSSSSKEGHEKAFFQKYGGYQQCFKYNLQIFSCRKLKREEPSGYTKTNYSRE